MVYSLYCSAIIISGRTSGDTTWAEFSEVEWEELSVEKARGPIVRYRIMYRTTGGGGRRVIQTTDVVNNGGNVRQHLITGNTIY